MRAFLIIIIIVIAYNILTPDTESRINRNKEQAMQICAAELGKASSPPIKIKVFADTKNAAYFDRTRSTKGSADGSYDVYLRYTIPTPGAATIVKRGNCELEKTKDVWKANVVHTDFKG